MAEFRLNVREGKDDFGPVTVHVSELAYKPEVAITFQYERGGQEEFLGWAGKLWQCFKGPGRKPVDKETFAALLATKPDPNPFTSGYWANPFEPDRSSFSQDPRRANPFEGRRLSKDRKKAIRLEEVGRASRRLMVADGKVYLNVDAPRVLVMVNPGKTVHLQAELPDSEGYVEPGQWNAFRADRMGDAEAFAKALAQRDGLEIHPMSGRLDVIFAEPLIRSNDVAAPAADALGRFVNFVDKFSESLSTEVLGKASEAKPLLDGKPGLDSVEQADAAYALVREVADLLRGITPSEEASMVHEATLWVCDTAGLRYETVDRDWLVERCAGPLSRF